MLEKIFVVFVLYFGLDGEFNVMPGENVRFMAVQRAENMEFRFLKYRPLALTKARRRLI